MLDQTRKGVGKMEKWKRCIALAVFLALLVSCGQTEGATPEVPATFAPAESVAPSLSPEELAAVEAAEATLESFRWPEETEVKTLKGQKVEFVRYHGNGWTVQIPADWAEAEWEYANWHAPSKKAWFRVSKHFLPVNNPKWYRAQTGSWRHETHFLAPFDYYYDDDGGYHPPEGDLDSVYFFAPAGENSYEFTLSGVVGETTEEEKDLLEAILLSFTQDEGVHTLRDEDYVPGRSLWEFVMAGLLAESEALWFEGWNEETSQGFQADGKCSPEYVACAQNLTQFQPGEFVQTYFGCGPEGAEELRGGSYLDLCLKGPNARIYLYPGSQWVCLVYAGEDWWTQAADPAEPEKSPYDVAMAWMEAERARQS